MVRGQETAPMVPKGAPRSGVWGQVRDSSEVEYLSKKWDGRRHRLAYNPSSRFTSAKARMANSRSAWEWAAEILSLIHI